jgi:electron transfer flavoprotein beta subunit
VKIAVCIKRVPEMDVRFKIAPSGTGVDETGLKWDMSDFDGYAVEAALQITEKLGSGEVVVVSLGPDAAQETLRKALSMGATRAVHLKADPIPFDNFAIAKALAAELQGGGYDLILFGKLSIDSSNGAVGPMTAELLEFTLPAVVTIDEGVARPRYPSLKGIMAAKKKPLEVKPAQLGDVRMTVTTMALPPERPPGRIVGEGVAAVPELVRLLQTEAKVL